MDFEFVICKFNDSSGDEEEAAESLLEYAEQIQNFFSSGNLNPTKLEYYLGLAFKESKTEGLLGFLSKKIAKKPFDKVKEAIFQVIHYVIMQKSWSRDAERFFLGFKNSANVYLQNSKESARLHGAALDCLVTLFDNYGSSLDLEDFGAAKLYVDVLQRSEKTTYQPSVRGKMFALLGTLGALGDNSYMRQPNWFQQLFSHITATITHQVESADSHLEVSILHGCLKGFEKLLGVYGPDIDQSDKTWLKFQENLQMIVDPKLSLDKSSGPTVIKRREFQRAALEIVANHGYLLQTSMFEKRKYKQWYEDLIMWAKSPNADDNRIGRRTMYTFLEVIITQCMVNSQSGTSEGELQAFFKYFFDKFQTTLQTKNANRIELTIAVRGFGLLSNLCKERNQVIEMLNSIMTHVENIIHELDSSIVDKYNSSISYMATYLESVASILPALKAETDESIPEKVLESLKKFTVLLIRFYPDMGDGQRLYCHNSVVKVFDALWNHHHTLCEPFIDQVFQQSLLHLVSCPTQAEVDILIEAWNKSHPNSKKSALSQLGLKPVRSYLPFWKSLLSSKISDSSNMRFDLFMQWTLSTIGKLNLAIVFPTNDQLESPAESDPIEGASPVVLKDFQIFVNLVDLYQEIVTGQQLLSSRWIVVFSRELLEYIKTNPLVSGFYKMLSVVLNAARQSSFFEQPGVDGQSLQQTLSVFLHYLGIKIQEFRDDLLFAVLELWVCLPDKLVLHSFGALTETLRRVFTIGKSSYILAIKGIDAIERWFFQEEFPVTEIETIMNAIFPILKTYFVTPDSMPNEDEQVLELKRQKGMKTLIKKNIQTQKSTEDQTLQATQLKILHLLGSFGQFITVQESQHHGLSKDMKYLQYTVPFVDCKPEFYIDDMLPQIFELSENAVVRQTRISACEFLHTIILIFIGKSRDGGKDALFRKLFAASMKLGCDTDIVVRQLFNPLCLQMVHWFTKRSSPYAGSMMDIIMENLTRDDDMNRRELAALCIGEYFQWKIRQDELEGPKAVLKSIFAMSTHASANYRQGAVMAFNSIYRDFREDTGMTSEFTLNLLFSFLTSLKLSRKLPNESLLITSTKQAIKHLERILIKKKDRFNTALPRYFKPAATETPCLHDVLKWLAGEIGTDTKCYQEEVIRLIEVLCKVAKGVSSVEQFVILQEEEFGKEVWISLAENSFKQKASTTSELLSYLDTASSVYEFLHSHGVLRKGLFLEANDSVFFDKLFGFCGNESEERLNDQEKLLLLQILARLQFANGILDGDKMATLIMQSMTLSKQFGNDSADVLTGLVNVWTPNLQLCKTLSKCCELMSMDIVKDCSLINDDDILSFVHTSIWHRRMAQRRIMDNILPPGQKESILTSLWEAVHSTIFIYRNESSTSNPSWEAKTVTNNVSKLLNNYLITSIYLGLKPEMITEAIFDASPVSVKDGTFQLVSTKGNTFQQYLMDAIVHCKQAFDFPTLLVTKPIRDVGNFILNVLRSIKANKLTRQEFRGFVMKKVLQNWNILSINCDVSTTVKIFTGLLAIDTERCKNSVELSDWWNGNHLMQAVHLDAKEKAQYLGYALVFVQSQNKDIRNAISKTIARWVESDLNPSSQSWIDMEQHVGHGFRKILQVFEQIKCRATLVSSILRILVKLTQWLPTEHNHALFRLARVSAEKAVKVCCETDSERMELVSQIYTVVTSNDIGNQDFVENEPVWKHFLLTAVSVLGAAASKNFFKRHLYHIISRMDLKEKNKNVWKAKAVSVYLLELLVYQTDMDFIKGGDLAFAYIQAAEASGDFSESNKKNEDKLKIVYRALIGKCLNTIIKTDLSAEDDSLYTAILKCHQACYNTLVATMIVGESEFKFVSKFLFCGKNLYENIVDKNEVYEFPLLVDEVKHKAGVTSSIRRSTETNIAQNSFDLLLLSGNLTGSSLAPEATSYDFTRSVTVANSEFYQSIYANPATVDGNGPEQIQNQTATDYKLEWNEVNQHCCMFAFVETLKRMREFHNSGQMDDRTWLNQFVKLLKNPNISRGVKTFLIGGMINTPESMEPFADELFDPIIELVVTGCFGTVKLNHFVQDVLISLISWVKSADRSPSDESLRKLLLFIVDGLKAEEDFEKRRELLKHVLGILESIIKSWPGQSSVIPFKEIFSLGSPNPAAQDGSLRLHVCSSILSAGLLPNPNELHLVKFLSKSLTSKYKTVYMPAATCLGQLFKKVQTEAEDNLNSLLIKVTENLQSFSRTRPIVFVDCLLAIQVNFPTILTKVKNTIMELLKVPHVQTELIRLLPLLYKQLLVDAGMESLLHTISPSVPNAADHAFADLEGRRFFESALRKDVELEAATDLASLLVTHCSQPSKLLKMVDWIRNAGDSSSSAIKVKFAGCLVRLYDRLLTEAVQKATVVEENVKQKFMKIFVNMYETDDESVKEEVNKFWNIALESWNHSADMILGILDLIAEEEHSLDIFVGLILQRCSSAPEFSKLLFSEPLENCEFHPFQLDTSWRLRHSSFQPLFAESLSSQHIFGTLPKAIQASLFSQKRSVGKFGMNVLRATLKNLQFTPTQQSSEGNNEQPMEVDQNSYQFDNSRNVGSGSTPGIPGNQAALNDTTNSTMSSPVLHMRRKFYARKDTSFYATKEVEKQNDRVSEAKELLRSRVSGVKTVRSYRIGELPDILITNADILHTLLKLAKQDETICRQFLALLFQGMEEWLQHSPKRQRTFISKTKETFERVIKNSFPAPNKSLITLVMQLSISNSISLPVQKILDVCKMCNIQKLGILQLEEEIENDINGPPSSKRARGNDDIKGNEGAWIGLGDMFKDIEEYDVLGNIFDNMTSLISNTDQKNVFTSVRNAVYSESNGDLEQAVSIFDEVLSNASSEMSSTTRAFLEDSVMNCLAKLGSWDTLLGYTSQFLEVDKLSDLLTSHSQVLDRFVPSQILSGMQMSLRRTLYVKEDEDCDEMGENESENGLRLAYFNAFMEKCLISEEGTNLMEESFPFDLGVWLTVTDENEYCSEINLMLEKGHESAIQKLKNIDILPLRAQRQLLTSLIKLTTLHTYRKWQKQGNNNLTSLRTHAFEVLKRWTKLFRHQPYDLEETNIISSYRDYFLSSIGLTFMDEEQDFTDILSDIQCQRLEQELWLANLGAAHKNLPTSRNSLHRIKESRISHIKPVEYTRAVAVSLAKFSEFVGAKAWCKRWKKVWAELGDLGTDPQICSIRTDLLYCFVEKLSNFEQDDEGLTLIWKTVGENSRYMPDKLDAKSKSNETGVRKLRITINSGLIYTNRDGVLAKLGAMTTELIPQWSPDASTSTPELSILYKGLFRLFKKLSDASNDQIDESFAKNLLVCTMRGCAIDGHANEMLQLSNIFSLLKAHPQLNQIFEELVPAIPTYLFLPWLDQVVTAHKAYPETMTCFKGILDRLVQDFPNAFQLQYPEYLDANSQLFAKALKSLVLPHRMHENTIMNIIRESAWKKRVSLLKEFQGTLQEIINNTSSLFGEYHTSFARDMFEIVNKLVPDKASQSSDSSSQGEGLSNSQFWIEAKNEMQNVLGLAAKKSQGKRVINLDKFSPFFSNFHFFEYSSFEKPGLYEDFKKPSEEHHTFVVSFHPTVQTFRSLTLPLRITIVTNDGKRSNFLAKLGDDLRQDRRIQQLLKVSNVLFNSDLFVKGRNLSIATYACIPITPNFGLIEMFGNVMSLMELLFEMDTKSKKRQDAMKKYVNWMTSNCPPEYRGGYDYYGYAAETIGHEEAVKVFSEIADMFPKFMLRDEIKRRSSSLQDFFQLRQSLIKDYGAMCMVHWVLGIGDRHLENCMLSLTSGHLVGIDFGRAFGTSNYVIPIPEMVPFRLTPQIQNIMLPYTYKGLFRESCILAWKCLRDAAETILTVSNVFIEEPTLDWLKVKVKKTKKLSQTSDSDSQGDVSSQINACDFQSDLESKPEFLPFEIMKRKLKNHNPAQLVVAELKMHTRLDVPKRYCPLVSNSRIHYEKEIVSSEEYVDVLLDLATDKNVLSRLFVGWNSWV